MGKEPADMTSGELWDLFPIFLVPHDERQGEYQAEIHADICDLLAACPPTRVSHIGSTAAGGIWAKNIVDVTAELSEGADTDEVAHVLERTIGRSPCLRLRRCVAM